MEDEREEELSSLTAIYPEIETSAEDGFSFRLDIPVTPASPLSVHFSSADMATSFMERAKDEAPLQVEPGEVRVHISHLPPIHLRMTLPLEYPADKPPIAKLSSIWISSPKIAELEAQADLLWEEYGHAQTAYLYIDYLQQAAESVFDLKRSDGSLSLHHSLKTDLVYFDKFTKKQTFDAETFDCGVCLDPRKGHSCHRLHKCGHVFCVQCLREAYDAAILEGDISSVKCLFPDCGVERDPVTKRATKAAPTLGPDELLEIPIARPAVERYVKLKRKKRFASFPKTVYCPRKWCQGIARGKRFPKKAVEQMTAADLEPDMILSEADAEPKDLKNREDRLRICEDCEYAFCRVCLAGWHGDYVLRCWPRTADELTEDEKASYAYLLKHTSPCPSCDFAIQKSMGCNHITCFNCRNHFCYLCSAWLDSSNPYEHFNKPGTPCNQRLWDMEEGDNADGNAVFQGIRGAEMAAALAIEEEEQAVAAQLAAQNPPAPVDRAQEVLEALNLHEPAVHEPAARAPEIEAFHAAFNDAMDNWDPNDNSDDEWEQPPAHWRNNLVAQRPAGRPRAPRRRALGGDGFQPHRRGERFDNAEHRRRVRRDAAADARDGARVPD